jgi:hypothetical protein
MKKVWNTPSISNFGNVSQITNQVTVTCPSTEKEFGSEDGFVVSGQTIGCPS